jgi:hypothetical protein
MPNVFNHIISLGASCLPRHYLARFMIQKHGIDRSVSYFFDWLWRRGNLDSVTNWLADELTLEAINWQLCAVDEHLEVTAPKYGFFFPHEFFFTSRAFQSCEMEMKQQMPGFISKYRYLRKRTLDALASRSRVALLLEDNISREQFERLDDVLTRQYRIEDYTLFCFPNVAIEATVFSHARMVSSPIVYLPWPGHEPSWSEAFWKIDLDLKPVPKTS